MSRLRLFPLMIILLTLAVALLDVFGLEAFKSPESFRSTLLLAILQRASASFLHAENGLGDIVAREGSRAAPDPRLVFLALDNDSVSIDSSGDFEMLELDHADKKCQRALQLMSNGWPWSREIYSLVIERLLGAGAKVVAFDLNFPTATPNDAPFREALDTFRNRVVIGATFSDGNARAGGEIAFSRPSITLIPLGNVLDHRIGIVNFWPDTDMDDVIRSAQYRLTLNQVVDGASLPSQDVTCLSLAAQAAEKAGFGSLIPPGFDSRPFRFSGPAGTYAPHSIFEIFAPEYWQRNYQNGEFFRGKIVLIGSYGNWQHDQHPTPFGPMPGPEVHLNALNALLHQDFLHPVPPAVGFVLIMLGGLLPLLVQALLRSPWGRVGAVFLIDGLWLKISIALFNHSGLLIAAAVPLALLNLNSVAVLFRDAIAARRESQRVRRTLERYVSRNVVREMLDNSGAFVASLGGTVKPATILFSDIRNFSSASAVMDPHELVLQLNEYLSAMVECVFEFGGTLDKFIGDAVMAVWGNVQTRGPAGDACNAVRAANAMQERLKELNGKWALQDRIPFEIGIALNYGDVVIGNVGSPHRMEYTVIGDAVNISWRLQELTKDLGEPLLLGESVAGLIASEFPIREVAHYRLPKTNAMVRVFALKKDGAEAEDGVEAELQMLR